MDSKHDLDPQLALPFTLDEEDGDDALPRMLAEAVLARDWLTPEEDDACAAL